MKNQIEEKKKDLFTMFECSFIHLFIQYSQFCEFADLKTG